MKLVLRIGLFIVLLATLAFALGSFLDSFENSIRPIVIIQHGGGNE